MISVSFKIVPVCTSIILTGFVKRFSILCLAPLGTKTVSFTFLKNFFLSIVILAYPEVTVQCSERCLCFCKLIDDLEFNMSSFTKNPFP